MNVEQATNRAVWIDLDHEIKECSADSVLGAHVVTLLNRAETLWTAIEPDDDFGIETDVRRAFINAALQQARVWYFG